MADKDRSERVLEAAPDMVSIHDLEGTYLYASPSSADLLGYPPSQLVGTSAYDLFHADDVGAVLEAHLASAAQARTLVQYRARRSDGRYVWLESQNCPVQAEQGDSCIVSLTRDIDHRRPDWARAV